MLIQTLFSITRLRRFFYFVTPEETTFERIEDVPPYVDEAVPYFFLSVFIEAIVLILKNEHPQLNCKSNRDDDYNLKFKI